ncbi:carboxyl transferase domain-containing protein, partial [Streptomyces glaucosporus]|uniref:carboxyl transferase domain-containing protein n=1 Tax=Streptomyces glaucosporus TaxID=284044 RepID=UPI0031D9A852
MTILDDLTSTQTPAAEREPVPEGAAAPLPGPDLRRATAELHRLKEEVGRGPDPEATRRQHAKGKLTARERLDSLFDEGTFTEVEPLRRHRATGFGLEDRKPHGDGVVTGWGTVHGRTVFAYAHDFRIFGGALGEAHAQKIHKIMDMALAAGA